MKLFLTSLFLFIALSISSQTASFSGEVTAYGSGEPLGGVIVLLTSATDTLGTAGDADGRYSFENIKPGRYDLNISYVGFYPLEIKGYLIGSGPATGRNFVLEDNPSLNLPSVVVRSSPILVNPLSREITLEQVRRLPATFYDPARLLALSPGVVQTNDQGNHLSVRGNSPNQNLWRINGLAIINPNHTANAGTISDQPSFSGGGVNGISAQLLDNSTFYAGGVPVEYGHATGGTFDMRLRPGNNQRRQHQVQVGLIGIDLATEGPIGKRPNAASYIANYRYSFTGLLGDLGVDFGGEEIRFQDFNLHIHQPLKNGGEISWFGIGGLSSNVFTPPVEREDVTEEKELFNIDFDSQFGILGTTYRQRIGTGELNLGAAYSTTTSKREQLAGPLGIPSNEFGFSRQLRMKRTSGNAGYQLEVTPRSNLKAGLELLIETTRNETTYPVVLTRGNYQEFVYSPYLNYTYRADHWRYSAGLRYSLYGERFTNSAILPRLAVTHYMGGNSFTFGLEGMSQLPTYALLEFFNPSAPLSVPITYQANLSWKKVVSQALDLQVSAYYQTTNDDYLVSGSGIQGGAPANTLLSLPAVVTAAANVDTRRYGLELAVNKPIQNDEWYYSFNASVFNSEYRVSSENDFQPGRYAQRFTTRLLVGKEWTGVDKKGRSRAYGTNLALLLNGGERQPELDVVASAFDGYENDTYNYRNGFSVNTGTYFRPDLRIYKRKFRKKTTTTLALDIQNVASISNTAYTYYDNFLNRPEERQQLTLIPVLSYRIEWR